MVISLLVFIPLHVTSRELAVIPVAPAVSVDTGRIVKITPTSIERSLVQVGSLVLPPSDERG